MTRCQRDAMVFVGAVFQAVLVVGCTFNDTIGGPDPDPDPNTGGVATSGTPGPQAPTPTPTPTTTASPCALQAGSYQEMFATSDANCAAIAAQQFSIGQSGMLEAGGGCTASSTASCMTTVNCSATADRTTTTSTLVVTTGGTSATGTATITNTTVAPAGCSTSIFCPANWCLLGGYCYETGAQTCHYTVTLSKT